MSVCETTELLTGSELAARLRVHRSTIGRMQDLPFVRLGTHSKRYSWPIVLQWLESRSRSR